MIRGGLGVADCLSWKMMALMPTRRGYQVVHQMYRRLMSQTNRKVLGRARNSFTKVTLMPNPGLYARQPKPLPTAQAWNRVGVALRTSTTTARSRPGSN